jgi:hypothetical protein
MALVEVASVRCRLSVLKDGPDRFQGFLDCQIVIHGRQFRSLNVRISKH